MRKFSCLSALTLLIPSLAAAQVLGSKTNEEPLKTVSQNAEEPASQAIQAQVSEETALPQMPPVEITPEQKIYARREIRKDIQDTVVNANKAEREKILDAVETLQKIKNRQANLKRAPEEQVPYEAPKINASSRQDVQKYLQETFVDTLDDSFKTPDQEQ